MRSKTRARARSAMMLSIASSTLILFFAVSFPATASASKLYVPSAVRSVHATGGNSRAVIKWSAPKSDGGFPIKKYVVTSHPLNKTCTTIGTKCAISGLANAASYEFTVVAVNKEGSGPISAPSNHVTPKDPVIISIPPPALLSRPPHQRPPLRPRPSPHRAAVAVAAVVVVGEARHHQLRTR